MIHRKILRVPAIADEQGRKRPAIDLPRGVSSTTLEYNADKASFIIECWLSDLLTDPSLVDRIPGEEVKAHPKSPGVLGRILVAKERVDPVSGLVGPPDLRKPVKPIKQVTERHLDYVVVDEG